MSLHFRTSASFICWSFTRSAPTPSSPSSSFMLQSQADTNPSSDPPLPPIQRAGTGRDTGLRAAIRRQLTWGKKDTDSEVWYHSPRTKLQSECANHTDCSMDRRPFHMRFHSARPTHECKHRPHQPFATWHRSNQCKSRSDVHRTCQEDMWSTSRNERKRNRCFVSLLPWTKLASCSFASVGK